MLELNKTEHLYYCEEYTSGNLQTYGSWEEFAEAYNLNRRHIDHDSNYLIRFDLDKDCTHEWRLKLYYMQQRRGRYVPVFVRIKPDDLEKINKYLESCWKYTTRLWEEFSGLKED